MLKNALRLFCVSLLILAASCAPKRVALPSYEGTDLRDYMEGLQNISEMQARMSVMFERSEGQIKGDAALDIAKNGDLSLRIYSLGFLAFQLTSREGIVNSSVHIDENKSFILTQGLRDCLFWWNIRDYTLSEDEGHYLLKSPGRVIWIDRKTFLPTKQKIYIGEDKEITIYYEDPAKSENFWYQSKIRIELAKYRVTITVKDISLKT